MGGDNNKSEFINSPNGKMEAAAITTLFSVRGVYIYPSKTERIAGTMFLVRETEQNGQEAFSIRWANQHSNPSDYAMTLKLHDIRCLQLSEPLTRSHSLTIIGTDGITYPSYYFQQGGLRRFFNQVRACAHVQIVASPSNPNHFLVESVGIFDAARQRLSESADKPSNNNNPTQKASVLDTFSWHVLEGATWISEFTKQVSKEIEDRVNTSMMSINESQQRASKVDHQTNLGSFRMLSSKPCAPVPRRTKEMDAVEWMESFDMSGRLKNPEAVRLRIHSAGLDPSVRAEAWKFLLNMYGYQSTATEREETHRRLSERYQQWKAAAMLVATDTESHNTHFQEQVLNIDKDVPRTDRSVECYKDDKSELTASLRNILITYCFFDADIGYVQGMNDFLSVILFVMGNESDAFWCFKGLMDRVRDRFMKDQPGVQTRLQHLALLCKLLDPDFYDYLATEDALHFFFCFRWILLDFKREFSFQTIQRVWEILWTDDREKSFDLFIALAILFKHRNKIMKEKLPFDEILRLVNQLAMNIDLDSTLVEAENLYASYLNLAQFEPIQK